MTDAELLAMVGAYRIVAAVRAPSAETAVRAAEAAVVGGMKLIEVAATTPGSFRVVSDLRHRYGDRISVGVGGVLNFDQIDRGVKAGAQFVSTPHTSAVLIEFCRRHRVPPIVGALTPSEVAAAAALGVSLVTMFPVSSMGGVPYVRFMTGLMPDIRLIVSGGVGFDDVPGYLATGAFAVSLGSGLFTPGDLQNENYVAIAERARSLLKICGIA